MCAKNVGCDIFENIRYTKWHTTNLEYKMEFDYCNCKKMTNLISMEEYKNKTRTKLINEMLDDKIDKNDIF